MRAVAFILALALAPAVAVGQPIPATPAAKAAAAPPAKAVTPPAAAKAAPAIPAVPAPPAAPPAALGREPELSRAQNTAIA